MDQRPMIQQTQSTPASSSKSKRSAAPKKGAADKSDVQEKKKSKKTTDSELEALEQKRKVLVLKNKWVDKLKELIAEAGLGIQRSSTFEECDEFPNLTYDQLFSSAGHQVSTEATS